MQLTSNSDKITRDFFDSLLIETRYLDAVIAITSDNGDLQGELNLVWERILPVL